MINQLFSFIAANWLIIWGAISFIILVVGIVKEASEPSDEYTLGDLLLFLSICIFFVVPLLLSFSETRLGKFVIYKLKK